MKRRWIWILVVVVLAGGGLFAYSRILQQRAAQNSQVDTAAIQRGSLTALVGATGTVRANQTTMLSWQTTGQIGAVNVQVGDTVTTGEILAELMQNSLPQNVILAQADLVTAQRDLQDLQTSQVARANAQLALSKAQDALNSAQKARTSKDYARSSQATIEAARADYVLAQNQVEKAQDAFNGVADRGEEDPTRAAALSALSAAQKARDRALANLNYLLSKPNSQEIAQADAQLQVAQANLEDAQREWDRLKDGPDPQDIKAAEAHVEALQATLDMIRLDTPFPGTITEVNSKVGDTVSPGTASFRIDDLSRLLVDVEVSEVDINNVKLNQPVQLSFDAIQGKQFNGTVVQVASIGQAQQGIVNFLVTVELKDPNHEVRPGMTAAANIVVKQLDNTLLVPNKAVRLLNNQRVVYILKNGVPTPVNITLGASDQNNSELVGGDLKEGDQVMLNPPVNFSPSGGPRGFGQ